MGPGLKSGIKLRLDNPAQLGAELLCGAVAALAESAGPLVVISADTAISMMAVNEKQELVGGVILPGPQLSLDDAGEEHRPAAPDRPWLPAHSGLHPGQKHLCLPAERLCAGHRQPAGRSGRRGSAPSLARRLPFTPPATCPAAIRDACRTPIRYRETLITDGLHRIWLRNRKG